MKGTFTFEPVTNFWLNTNSVAASEVFGVGILPTMIIIDEEFDKWKKDEIPTDFVIPDIDMDYEEKREQYQGGGANVLQKIIILCNGTAYHDKYNVPIENFDFTMEMELLPDNAYRMTVILPDLLLNGYEASTLKAPVRIKCDALTNRAKYYENKILGTMQVRSDELDQPGGTYYMQTQERNVWYNEKDGGNIWIDDDTNWISNHRNKSEPCEVLADSFTFEYKESVEEEYIKSTKMSRFNANCKAWETKML